LSLEIITGFDLVRSTKAGCINLEHNRDKVDLLNVFPVPDGDTGTNMYLTLLAAVKEGEKNVQQPLGQVAKAMSRGSLMGARGNSGVILSQIFRGMAKVLENKEQARALDLAMAIKSGSNTAYEAVMKPVEGTILTVIREIAGACEKEAQKGHDIVATLIAGIQAGSAILKKTPSMLPILKQAGVVDAGGQGLLFFLEGMIEGLAEQKDIKLETYPEYVSSLPAKDDKTVDIEFQYCTEVLVKGDSLNTEDIKDHLKPLGDSLLVVGGDDIIKIHVHSNHPGKVLETCLQWGSLNDIKINNMLEEVHEHKNNWVDVNNQNQDSQKKIGLVAVGIGEGIAKILTSLGVDKVVEGGQTMNPSTEDFLNACKELNTEAVIILPNNSNIIMAAKQVEHLVDQVIRVVPTKSVMQAITALIAYDATGDIEDVAAAMTEEMQNVKFGEITYAIRDSVINDVEIKKGDIIGIIEDQIVLSTNESSYALKQLVEKMIDDSTELITVLYGQDVTEEDAQMIKAELEEDFSEFEVEIHNGGQPHYQYWVSVE